MAADPGRLLSRWSDLKRRALRPEAKSRIGLPALRRARSGLIVPSASACFLFWRGRLLLTWLVCKGTETGTFR